MLALDLAMMVQVMVMLKQYGEKTSYLMQLGWTAVYVSQSDKSRGQLTKKVLNGGEGWNGIRSRLTVTRVGE